MELLTSGVGGPPLPAAGAEPRRGAGLPGRRRAARGAEGF